MMESDTNYNEQANALTLKLGDNDLSQKERDSVRLQILGYKLYQQATEQVTLKSPIEQRWLEDMRQYMGVYSIKVQEQFEAAAEDPLFVNATRNKCNAAEARLGDMLFPTDDKNWGIKPTPVPELANMMSGDESEDVVEIAPNVTTTKKDLASQAMDMAQEAAEAMEKEIDDQLTETKYNAKGRDAIHFSVVLGTGILKGPVVHNKYNRVFKKNEGTGVYELHLSEDLTPGVEVVDPWNYFPQMSARSAEDAEFHYERAFWTKKTLREMAKLPGFFKDKIREVLATEPDDYRTSRTFLDDMRAIAGINGLPKNTDYEGWMYTGPIERDDLIAAGVIEEDSEEDPLIGYECTVWMVGPIVIKAVLNVLDSGDATYSVYNWRKDDSCIFGYGVPFDMRNSQRVINASWRMMMDNSGLSTGPQIIVDKKAVQPADGNWRMKPRKVWYMTESGRSVRDVFAAFNIDSHQGELANIFNMARQLADEETNLPMLAQGEQGSGVTTTFGGMSILMNSANVVMRRAVKNYDDDVTNTLIPRFYEWNMLYSDKDEIKGDYQISARGSSVLLVRESQAQALMQVMTLSQSPVFGPLTKFASLYRKAVQALQLSPDDIVKSDDEIKDETDKANEAGNQNPQVMIKQMELQAAADRLDKELGLKREISMMELALEKEMTMEKLYASLGIEQMKNDTQRQVEGTKAQNFQNELHFKAASGRQGI